MTREWVAEHNGHKIRVMNTWFSGAKLYIDGECRDTANQLLATSATKPLLSAQITNQIGGHDNGCVPMCDHASVIRTGSQSEDR